MNMNKLRRYFLAGFMGSVLTLAAQVQAEEAFPYVTTPMEYTLYNNIFYNDQIADYADQEMIKIGTFSTIRDSFSGVTRYYVWGYNDETKCCDWQWEFVPQADAELPAEGSLIQLKGTFTADDSALDGCWLTDTELTVKKPWTESEYDMDMSTMSSTLERVQLINMQYYPEDYEGNSVLAYGRVEGPDTICHPYYDGAWTQKVISNEQLPAIGTTVLVSGIFEEGEIRDADAAQTDLY